MLKDERFKALGCADQICKASSRTTGFETDMSHIRVPYVVRHVASRIERFVFGIFVVSATTIAYYMATKAS
jgi:hypothetical protein